MRVELFFLALLVSIQATYALEGDIDGDGKVSSADALAALRMAVGKQPENALADVDRDGRVTTVDASRILLLALGRYEPKEKGRQELLGILKRDVEAYNKNLEKVPGAVKIAFGNERIDWTITLKDGTTMKIGVVTRGGAVVEFKEGDIPEPTMKLHSTEGATRRILDSRGPFAEYQKALDSGEMSYEGVGATKKAKLFLTGLAVKVLGRFL